MTLITVIIKSYSALLLAIGGSALLSFVIGFYLIIRLARAEQPELEEEFESDLPPSAAKVVKKSKRSEKLILSDAMSDVSAISGEDPVATQLDLAKAYIESGKSQLARIILAAVIRNGTAVYQEEAQRLLSTI